jgi:hypothetical protein
MKQTTRQNTTNSLSTHFAHFVWKAHKSVEVTAWFHKGPDVGYIYIYIYIYTYIWFIITHTHQYTYRKYSTIHAPHSNGNRLHISWYAIALFTYFAMTFNKSLTHESVLCSVQKLLVPDLVLHNVTRCYSHYGRSIHSDLHIKPATDYTATN